MLLGRSGVVEEIVEPVHVCIIYIVSVLLDYPWAVRMLGLVVSTYPELIVVFIIVICEAGALILHEELVDKGCMIVTTSLEVCAHSRRMECKAAVVIHVSLTVLTLLCSDEDHTERSLRTVDSGRRRILED